MDLIQNLLLSAYLGGLVYMFGMFLIHPYSPLCKILEKNYDYDTILNKFHKISLIAWLASGVVVFYYFEYVLL
jgi:hypothetical protein